MTDIQDLRIGNKVSHDPSGLAITILKVGKNKVLLDTFPESYWFNKDISGIPLTTALLRKLSFTYDEQCDTWRGQGVSIHIKADGVFYGLRILKSRTKMQYLHQLQNYVSDYYSLFKKLTYSLNLGVLYK